VFRSDGQRYHLVDPHLVLSDRREIPRGPAIEDRRACGGERVSAPRPNLLIFMADQLRADMPGCFGGPALTPNIDALARSGVRYTAAYSQSSVCAPSRISMQTSWYPHVRGHRSIAHLLQRDEPSLFKSFRDAGYFVAAPGLRGDTFSPDARAEALDRWGFDVKPETWFEFAPGDEDSARARAFFHGRRTSGEPVLDMDEACVRTAERWIADGLPEPFVLFVSLFFPHPPFEVEEPWYSLHDRARFSPPPSADLARKPQFMRDLSARQRLDRYGDDDWRELKAVYAGMVARVDHHFGRIVEALDAKSAKAGRVTCFLSDHGEYLGDFGLVEKWPSGLDDCLLRNPLIVAGAGAAKGEACNALVEMIDLAPTLAEICGVTLSHRHFGKSLTKTLADPRQEHRPAVFSEGGFSLSEDHLREKARFPYDIKSAVQNDHPSYVGRAVSVRTDDWTYVYRVYEPPELYDRAADAGEVANLAGHQGHAAIEAELKAQVLAWLVETSDVSPLTPDPRF
jgi:arylsulfatase A-like enzyme